MEEKAKYRVDRISRALQQSTEIDSHIDTIMNDMTASYWLRSALKSAMLRDPVDAANDAEILAQIMSARAELLLDSK